MRQLIARFVWEEDGQDLVEYAFLAIFLALAAAAGLQAITSGLNAGYSNIGTEVAGS